MRWNDVTMIAEELRDKFPQIDPKAVRFVELHNWVCELEGFDDDPQRGGERVLEAIQGAWIAEADEDED
jgi:FeS assembly protein IscX